ncbi:carbohydrate ABC transporter permease [Nakamurella flavida]|uniref:Carbohydrate ABC transporter permease n=1 Tax=Nakamurella flavida TaxID=363630 RepID=A0A939C773_9ACTN|nr:carbohydrate ABC transporter permease [Nakamurella flavida]MBM9477872.1 carbohydrate ABC transporter permease [Nakamurella flavida]MDP9778414.1 multiple sugar transport system permease protein [Nakamurella flavida]
MTAAVGMRRPATAGTSARWARTALRTLLIVVVCLVVVFPIYWMAVAAVQPTASTLRYPPSLVPTSFDLSGFRDVFANLPILRWLSNSAVLAVVTTVITVVLSVLGGYVLSALYWPGKALFGLLLLVTQMMPEAVVIIPVFQLYNDLHLVQSLIALAFLHAAFVLPVGVWILRSAMDGVPAEVREAALIDGCGHVSVLRRIVLPLTVPAVIAVGIVAFFASWGEYLFAVTMISDSDKYPASVGLATLIGQLDTPVQQLLAGGLVYALPPVVLFVLVQRHIVAGLTAGAVKG